MYPEIGYAVTGESYTQNIWKQSMMKTFTTKLIRFAVTDEGACPKFGHTFTGEGKYLEYGYTVNDESNYQEFGYPLTDQFKVISRIWVYSH